MAMVMSTTMIEITTVSSTNVKPRRRRQFLPFRIGCAIARLLVSLGVDRKHILPAPAGRFGVVLIAAQAPFGLAGERVARDFAQQLDLLAVRAVGELDALDELLQGLGPAVGPGLDRPEISRVAVVLVLVDGVVHLVDGLAQFALALDADPRPR